MAESLFEVAKQVLILFLLVGVGFVCGKSKLFSESAAKGITDLVLIVVIPCVIVKSFQRPFDSGMLLELGIAALFSVGIHCFAILLGLLFLRDGNKGRESVMRFAVVFSNAIFMSVPLQQALLGEDGVFYGATYVAVFNLLLWSYGVAVMGKGEADGEKPGLLSRLRLLVNPGVIGFAAGLLLFLFSVTLPEVIAVPVGHLAALNTPLPMIIVGYHLANARLLGALKEPKVYLTLALRLIVVPFVTLGAFLLLGIRGPMMLAIVIAASAPVGATVTMFAARYRQDVEMSVNLVSLSTLLSIATMPVVVGLAQQFA